MAVHDEKTVAQYLAELVSRISITSFSEKERSIVRKHMLDAVGAAFIGSRLEMFQDFIKLCPRTKEGCPWPGSGSERLTPIDAGMVWAYAIHSSVFEDGSREGACHPAAAVMPAIIALSEGKDWQLIDKSAIAAYDVMVRLARSGNPRFTVKGFHPTSITAPFGAAAAASVLLGYNVSQTESALCLAALGSAGLMCAFKAGQTQPLQVAWAVRSGIFSAIMAGKGFSGYSRIIEEGFYPAFLGAEPDPTVDYPLECEYAIQGCYLKPYPGCRHLHPSIDAFGKIMDETKINSTEIEGIDVGTYKVAVETEIEKIDKRGDAYFNIAYALAARAVLGKNDWDTFDEKHFTNEHLIKLMKKVKVYVDPEIDSIYPNKRGSIVEVHTVDGNNFYSKVLQSLGEPENPLSHSIIRDKFRYAAGPFLSKKSIERMENLLHVLEPGGSAGSLFQVVCENAHAI